jgi:hypothetical protein
MISKNESLLDQLRTEVNATGPLLNLVICERELAAAHQAEGRNLLQYPRHTDVDFEAPKNALAPLLSVALGDRFRDFTLMGAMLNLLRSDPDFKEAQRVVLPLLARIDECKTAIIKDQQDLAIARGRLEDARRALEEKALRAAAEDPEIARLEADMARAEAVLAGAEQDPAEVERQRKVRETLKPIRRRGEPLAVEAFAGDD